MSQLILPIFNQPNNLKTPVNSGNQADSKANNFTDILNNAVQQKPENISQVPQNNHKDISKTIQNNIPEKENQILHASTGVMIKDQKLKNPTPDNTLNEGVSAREFLEKLGIDANDIQLVLQSNGLNENISLNDFLKSFNFTINNLDNFLETPLSDFLSQLGLELGKVNDIVQKFTGTVEFPDENTITSRSILEKNVSDSEDPAFVPPEKENQSLDATARAIIIDQELKNPTPDNFLEPPLSDFLSQVGQELGKVNDIVQKFTGTVEFPDENIITPPNPNTDISLKNILEKIKLNSEQPAFIPGEELKTNNLSDELELGTGKGKLYNSDNTKEFSLSSETGPKTDGTAKISGEPSFIKNKDVPATNLPAMIKEVNLLNKPAFSSDETGDISGKQFFTKEEDLSLNRLLGLKKLGPQSSGVDLEAKNIDPLQKDKTLNLLKKAGLSSEETSKFIGMKSEDPTDKTILNDLLLHNDSNQLKKHVLSNTKAVDFSFKTDFPGITQISGIKGHAETLPGKEQPQTSPGLSSLTDFSDGPQIIPVQTSGTENSMNFGNGTKGPIANLPISSNELANGPKTTESIPKSLFERTIMDQIVSKVNFNFTGGKEEIRINLDPPSLGSLSLKISVKGKVVNATFVAENHITKEIIQSNIQQLKDSMVDQGLKVDNLSVLIGGEGSANNDTNGWKSQFTREIMGQKSEYEIENGDNQQMNKNSGSSQIYGGLSDKNRVNLFI